MITLETYQKKAVSIMMSRPHHYFAWGAGSGKTLTGAWYVGQEYLKGKKILVVCTNSLLTEWKTFLRDIHGLQPEHLTVLDTTASRNKYIKGRKRNIVLTTYGSFVNAQICSHFTATDFDILILDEAHKVKAPRGKIAKNIFKMCRLSKIPKRFLFSASMICNDYKDMFMQFKIMDGGKTLGDKYMVFEREYFIDLNSSWKHKEAYFPKLVFDETKKSKLLNRIKSKVDMIETKDVVTLPTYKVKDVMLTMPESMEMFYKKMKDEGLYEMKLRQPTLQTKFQYEEHVLGIVNKLRQMASGFYYYELKGERVVRVFNECPKRKFLYTFLKVHGNKEKVIVWFHFRATAPILESVCKSLNLKYSLVMGGDTPKKRERAINNFKNDTDTRVMLAHPRSGGEGLNLAVSRVSIYYTQDYSFKDDMQSSARNYRRGSDIHNNVVRINLRCKATIDEKIFDNLNSKSKLVEAAVKHIKN